MGYSKAAGADRCICFLDKGAKLEGILELPGTLRVEGELRGTVRCKEKVIVAESARVEGEIEGLLVSVAGEITGNIHGTNRVEILPSGVVEGEVHTPSLVIEDGGILDGRCYMPTGTERAKAPRVLFRSH